MDEEKVVPEEIEVELAAEKAEKKEKSAANLRTVLGAVCGFLAMGLIFTLCVMVFRRVPFLLYLGAAPAVWFFTWLFHGSTGKALRWASAIACVLLIYFGTCLHDSVRYILYLADFVEGTSQYAVYAQPSLQLIFSAVPPVMFSKYLLISIPDTMLYAILFSLTGYLVEWEFHGNPFARKEKKTKDTAPEA